MDKKVILDSSFYGDVLDTNRLSACSVLHVPCTTTHIPCFSDIPCTADIPCKIDIPCPSDTPCSDRPCSDRPCSDTPSPSTSGSISIVSTAATSIAIRLSSISLATSYVIVYRPSSTSSETKLPATTSLNNTISGLQTNTEYVINYYGQNDYGTGPYMPDGVIATTKKAFNIAPWSWNSSNGSASPAQTVAAYQAMMDEGASNEFSYKVWNDLVSKINEVIVAIGATWENSFTSYSEAKLSGSGQVLTAAKYNAARFNVGCHHSTGIAEVSGGDAFTWSYIFNLAEKLNEWIALL